MKDFNENTGLEIAVEDISFDEFEEMEEIITPGFLGFTGCCVDVSW